MAELIRVALWRMSAGRVVATFLQGKFFVGFLSGCLQWFSKLYPRMSHGVVGGEAS